MSLLRADKNVEHFNPIGAVQGGSFWITTALLQFTCHVYLYIYSQSVIYLVRAARTCFIVYRAMSFQSQGDNL